MLTSTLYTVFTTLVISLTAFIGFFTLSLNEKTLHRVLFVLVAYSAGTILGAALFDLLPEAVELVDEAHVFPIIAGGFVFFLFLERVIYWYHGHGHEYEHGDEKVTKGFAYLNLIGDFIHNFIDGMIIAAGFINGFVVGLTTAIAVLFHELPQEMGDYGILVYAGIERKRALFLNFLAAVSVIIGGVFGSLFIASVEELSGWMVAFSAGAFLFLSASELIPEMLKEEDKGRAVIQLAILVLGMLTIYSLGIVFPHE
ncbi:MAG TPA: ZIP family metal transporter [Candidatus Krumholzibacteriaceae bacterium]|nr:ZIP family metal transporter [Candidatus Krumholzibacteriaceae bacterium]